MSVRGSGESLYEILPLQIILSKYRGLEMSTVNVAVVYSRTVEMGYLDRIPTAHEEAKRWGKVWAGADSDDVVTVVSPFILGGLWDKMLQMDLVGFYQHLADVCSAVILISTGKPYLDFTEFMAARAMLDARKHVYVYRSASPTVLQQVAQVEVLGGSAKDADLSSPAGRIVTWGDPYTSKLRKDIPIPPYPMSIASASMVMQTCLPVKAMEKIVAGVLRDPKKYEVDPDDLPKIRNAWSTISHMRVSA